MARLRADEYDLVSGEIPLRAGAEETISYGMPAFKVRGKAVAGYAYFKNHCSYFPHSSAVLGTLSDVLNDYDRSKGTLKFAVDEALPAHLVRRLVDARLQELDRS